ncbi:hypothetical protein QA643_27205 [Bradyrhizobium sp. CB3481]|nr:hypothetical protein [Bradyrhizobium sp. CB3481]WFU14740.1 hypothetical protein QA643_27205 [Bradyrhizobium sp. CB3481]
MSQVRLTTTISWHDGRLVLTFIGDGDAHIVRALVAILINSFCKVVVNGDRIDTAATMILRCSDGSPPTRPPFVRPLTQGAFS